MQQDLLNTLRTLVEFLGKVMGRHCEIVLHDLSDYDNSIRGISNSLTGRTVGGPLTDFALRILKQSQKNRKEYFVNYEGKTFDGKPLRSSTMIIRDSQGVPAAMLCINIDTSVYREARSLLDRLVDGDNGKDLFGDETGVQEILENITPSIEDLTSSVIDRVLGDSAVAPERMTVDEKITVVRRLNDEGVFLLKGAVKEVAVRMKASEATVYRYISRLDNKNDTDREEA